MPREEFWEVIKDDDEQTFEVLGLSSDDTRINKLTCEMQHLGMHVRCETIPCDTPRSQIPGEYAQIDYRPEDGLYRRLHSEFERRRLQQPA